MTAAKPRLSAASGRPVAVAGYLSDVRAPAECAAAEGDTRRLLSPLCERDGASADRGPRHREPGSSSPRALPTWRAPSAGVRGHRPGWPDARGHRGPLRGPRRSVHHQHSGLRRATRRRSRQLGGWGAVRSGGRVRRRPRGPPRVGRLPPARRGEDAGHGMVRNGPGRGHRPAEDRGGDRPGRRRRHGRGPQAEGARVVRAGARDRLRPHPVPARLRAATPLVGRHRRDDRRDAGARPGGGLPGSSRPRLPGCRSSAWPRRSRRVARASPRVWSPSRAGSVPGRTRGRARNPSLGSPVAAVRGPRCSWTDHGRTRRHDPALTPGRTWRAPSRRAC